MKLREIQVDRFGNWQNLVLPVEEAMPTVVFGGNSSGKSTLARFIKGVLFGFRVTAAAGRAPQAASGSLVFSNEAGQLSLHRASAGGTAGQACLVGHEAARPASEFLNELLGPIDEALYDDLFLIDLDDLRDARPGASQRLAREIFGADRSPEAQRLVAAMRRAERARNELVDPLQHDGELVRRIERYDELTARLGRHETDRASHTRVCGERDRLERHAADLRARIDGIREQLCGHEFLERASRPWRHARALERELESLDDFEGFPADGPARLADLERDATHCQECLVEVRSQARALRDEMRALRGEAGQNRTLRAQRAFVSVQELVAAISEQRDMAIREEREAQLELQSLAARLEGGWTLEHMARGDLSSEARLKVALTAGSLADTRRRGRWLARRYRSLKTQCQALRDRLSEARHDLPDGSIAKALSRALRARTQARANEGARRRIAEIDRSLAALAESRTGFSTHMALPGWMYVVLGLFAFVGVVLTGWGLLAGVSDSAMAGSIYALLGLTCGGLAWGLKSQFETDSRARLEAIDAQAARLEREKSALIQSASDGEPAPPAPEEALADIKRLRELSRDVKQFATLRRRLARVRSRRNIARREIETASQNQTALRESIRWPASTTSLNSPAHEQALTRAAECRDRLARARTKLKDVETLWNACTRGIIELDCQIRQAEPRPALAALIEWTEQLARYDQRLASKRGLHRQWRARAREVRDYQSLAREIELKVQALLVDGGAVTREEFLQRARDIARREALARELAQARRAIEAACEGHADLAVVEEDLLAYVPEDNQECIATLSRELADLERDLATAVEQLAELTAEARRLEDDDGWARLRREVEASREVLAQSCSRWAATEVAASALRGAINDYERAHQTETLVFAQGMLARLTLGSVSQVWSRLSEDELCAGDPSGASLPIDALSRTTRQQLHLAVRLAAAARLCRDGHAPPLILDDILVNYDLRRAERAVEVLCELAGSGLQIIVLTSQSHLVQLFEGRQVPVLRLPDPHEAGLEQERCRLAG